MEPRALEPRVLRPRALSVDASGMTFGALAWGDTEAPLALLVHGYPDTAWTWRHLGPVLAQRGWHAVAPFTRGYAPTDLAPDDSYLIADQVSDIIRLEAALRGSGPSVLIGHDWGAVATWSVTQHHPTTFARYVALSVPPTATVIRAFASPRSLRLGLRQARMSWYFLYNQLPGAERPGSGHPQALARLVTGLRRPRGSPARVGGPRGSRPPASGPALLPRQPPAGSRADRVHLARRAGSRSARRARRARWT